MLPTAEHPIEKLGALAGWRATGELIATSGSAETHLYLHRGRLVWGVDSRRPESFGEHLHSTAGVTSETLREVLEECRRGRLPVAETLVAWGLTSADDLRGAMLQHLRETLAMLSHDAPGETFFLTRSWPEPDARLTFELAELDVAPPRSNDAVASASIAKSAFARFDGLAWAEHYYGAERVDAEPSADAMRVPSSILGTTLLDGADFTAVTARGLSLFGTVTRHGGSLWCRVSDGATIGGALAAIGSLDGALERRITAPQPRTLDSAWTRGDATWLTALRRVADRGHEVLGAIVLDARHSMIAGLGYGELSPDVCTDLCRRRSAALLDARGISDDPTPQLVTGEPTVWCYGAVLQGNPETSDAHGETTLWLLVDRSASQGLGWTYLTALVNAFAARARASS